jgi:hypothetical protein
MTEKKYTTEQLIQARRKIADIETQIQRAEGRLGELMSQLETDFGVKSLESAAEEVAQLDKQIESKTGRLNAGLKQLREDFQW